MLAAERFPSESKPSKRKRTPKESSSDNESSPSDDTAFEWSENLPTQIIKGSKKSSGASRADTTESLISALQENTLNLSRTAGQEDDDVATNMAALQRIEDERVAKTQAVTPMEVETTKIPKVNEVETVKIPKVNDDASELAESIADLQRIEDERVAKTQAATPMGVETVKIPKVNDEANEVAESIADLQRIQMDSERYARKLKESKLKIQDEKEHGNQNTEVFELLFPKEDIISLLDTFTVKKAQESELTKDALYYIQKNIDDINRIKSELDNEKRNPDSTEKEQRVSKLRRGIDIIHNNQEKIRSKLMDSRAQVSELLEKIAEEEVRQETVLLYPQLLSTHNPKTIPTDLAFQMKIDVVRSLITRESSDEKKVAVYSKILKKLDNERFKVTSDRLNVIRNASPILRPASSSSKKTETITPPAFETTREGVADRMRENLMALELEMNVIKRMNDPAQEAKLADLRERYNDVREQIRSDEEARFFAKEHDGEKPLSTEAVEGTNTLDVNQKILNGVVARFADNPIVFEEAQRRLKDIARQKEEAIEVLENRNIRFTSGDTAYPKFMGQAERDITLSVSRQRATSSMEKKRKEEKERRALTPFATVENYIERSRTEPLFFNRDYSPAVLRQERDKLFKERAASLAANNTQEVRDIDYMISSINSALRNLDLDRVNEALGTMQNLAAEFAEKAKGANTSEFAKERDRYDTMIREASHDAGDLLSRDVDNKLATLGITEDEYKTIRFGKVSLFSNARLWWIKTRHSGEIAKISTMMKRRNELQGRQDGQKL